MYKRLILIGLVVFSLSAVFAVPASADTATTTCGLGALASGLATTTPVPGLTIVVPLVTTTPQPGLTAVVPLATTCKS
jgi:hypothetical protein